MCGRFALSAKTKDIEKLIPGIKISIEPGVRNNIAPTQNISAVLNDGNRELSSVRWGLIPFWSKDMAIGAKLINARAETIAEKPSFRDSFRKRRCAIIASGFYEWKKEEGLSRKTPYFIKMKSGEPFAFAGLWDTWKSGQDSTLISATIITTEPNELIASIHNRMPVILNEESLDLWLGIGENDKTKLFSCISSYPADLMEAYPANPF
ncbi:MAG: hypothetical protein QG635_1605 [Bacteroidota bacterium]|nr:hypothetical protein [Bacteroidota bacterium]